MKNYTQLSEAERNQIYALKQAGHQKSAIAERKEENVMAALTGGARLKTGSR